MESSQTSFYTWLEQGLCFLKTQDQPFFPCSREMDWSEGGTEIMAAGATLLGAG